MLLASIVPVPNVDCHLVKLSPVTLVASMLAFLLNKVCIDVLFVKSELLTVFFNSASLNDTVYIFLSVFVTVIYLPSPLTSKSSLFIFLSSVVLIVLVLSFI